MLTEIGSIGSDETVTEGVVEYGKFVPAVVSLK